jgi:glycerol-3-phosphate dehydrogenase
MGQSTPHYLSDSIYLVHPRVEIMTKEATFKLAGRYRVVVLGGGIHGVGVAHDLASRGWKDVLVVEKSIVGAGTSSKSTKLIHGGLRYLQHPRDFPLVAEGLGERALLTKLLPDIVKPLPFVFPVMKKGGMPRFIIKIGLMLYDFLSRGRSLGTHKWLSTEQAYSDAPILDKSVFKGFYRFYDGQTDDFALTQRVADSVRMLGASVVEHTTVERIVHDQYGWRMTIRGPDGTHDVTAKYVVNALGPWAHELLDASSIKPKVVGFNNAGIHLIVRDLGLKAGLFLQSPEDGRIFFVLPWEGLTLIGTTEDIVNGPADSCKVEQHQVDYLLERCNRFLSVKLSESDVISKFTGMRWLARASDSSLSDTSRTHLITEHREQSDILYTIYGGKLTAYRALSEELGDKITRAFGDRTPSATKKADSWAPARAQPPELQVPRRFEKI